MVRVMVGVMVVVLLMTVVVMTFQRMKVRRATAAALLFAVHLTFNYFAAAANSSPEQ